MSDEGCRSRRPDDAPGEGGADGHGARDRQRWREVRDLAPGAVFAGGSTIPPGGSGAAAWASTLDGYILAASQSRLGDAHPLRRRRACTGTTWRPAPSSSRTTSAWVARATRRSSRRSLASPRSRSPRPASPGRSLRWSACRGTTAGGASTKASAKIRSSPVCSAPPPRWDCKGARASERASRASSACASTGRATGRPPPARRQEGGVVDRGDIRIDEATMRRYGIAPVPPGDQGRPRLGHGERRPLERRQPHLAAGA